MSVVVSTASAFKFCASVLTALGVEKQAEGTQILRQLSETTGWPVPKPLAALDGKKIRFTKAVQKTEMADAVMELL